jgi:hypothetical protein
MNLSSVNAINCGFCWLIVALSVAGYLVTLKRTRQSWPLWVVLSLGWALLAIPYTLLVIGISINRAQLSAIWLSSYLLVMASLLLLFLKLLEMMRRQSQQ